MSKQDFRLIVFDWDGTVMDSTANIVACMRQSLLDIGVGEVTDEAMRGTIGLGFAETLERILPGSSADLHEKVVERYRHHWLAKYRDVGIPFPGLGETLEVLSSRHYLLAVATGKGRPGLDHDFELTGFGRFFVASRTVSEAASKPHPQMLLDLMKELGTRPEETLMVGDTTFDLDMAKNANVPAVGVLTGSHEKDDLMASGPLVCLDGAVDLPSWLA
jgi:phosphoglycolate phosphatase